VEGQSRRLALDLGKHETLEPLAGKPSERVPPCVLAHLHSAEVDEHPRVPPEVGEVRVLVSGAAGRQAGRQAGTTWYVV